jgi:hypothetical protein
MPPTKKSRQIATATGRDARKNGKEVDKAKKVVEKRVYVNANNIVSYVRNLARDPSLDNIPMQLYGKHKGLIQKVLMALYEGPELGKKGSKRTRETRKRPCSPTLFREQSVFDPSSSISPARFSERGRRKHERNLPTRRMEEYLAFVGRTYYKPSGSNQGSQNSSGSTGDSGHGSKGGGSVVSLGDMFPRSSEKGEGASMFPGTNEQVELTLQRHTTIGVLNNPARKGHVLDHWTPYEIALFESAICIYGKDFHTIQKVVKTKSTKEIIGFYYLWKKSSHYSIWKRHFE